MPGEQQKNLSRTLLTREDLTDFLNAHSHWGFTNDTIARTVRFDTYLDGIIFVNRVAELAETAQHHPDLIVKWREVGIMLTTHDAKGVTQFDLDLAQRIDKIIDTAE